MPVAFRSGSSVLGTGQNATVAQPAGAIQGDVFIAVAICDDASTLARPAGWTLLYSGTAGISFRYDVAYIVRGASPPDLTWVLSSSVFREVEVVAFSGVDTTTPINTSSDGGITVGANPNPPAVTTTVADAMVVALGAAWASANPWIAPAGYTLRSLNAASDVPIASKLLGAAGAEDPGAFSGGSGGVTTDQWAGTIALAPQPPPPPATGAGEYGYGAYGDGNYGASFGGTVGGTAYEYAADDTVNAGDALTAQSSAAAADTATGADAVRGDAAAAVADTASRTDAVRSDATAAIADTRAATDNLTAELSGAAHQHTAASTAAASDAVRGDAAAAVADTRAAADTLAAQHGLDRQIASTAATTDALRRDVTATTADTATGADALTMAINGAELTASLASTATTSDTVRRDTTAAIVDAATAADALIRAVESGLADAATIADALRRDATATAADTAAAADALAAATAGTAFEHAVADVTAAADMLATAATAALADMLATVDTLDTLGDRAILIADVAVILDALYVSAGGTRGAGKITRATVGAIGTGRVGHVTPSEPGSIL